jgi:hypothetical protein
MKVNHVGDESKYVGDKDEHVGSESKYVGDEDKLLYVFSGNVDESELIIYINSLIINVMKTGLSITAKIFACLFIAGVLGFWGCASMSGDENGDNYTGGAVPYAPCPCEEKETDFPILKGEALLFIDSIPKTENFQNREGENAIRNYMVYYSKGDSAHFFQIIHAVVNIGTIYNYPAFAKRWNISDSGVKVDFEGKYYLPCYPIYGLAIFSHYSMILTELKLK